MNTTSRPTELPRPRLDRRYTQQRREIANLKQEAERLNRSVATENRKASDLQRKLDSILRTSVETQRFPSERVTLCIDVDMKMARQCRDGAIWKIAIDQLIHDIQQKVR